MQEFSTSQTSGCSTLAFTQPGASHLYARLSPSKEGEASSFFLSSVGSRYALCSVQVLHMCRNKTAAVRKLEQLFAFGATSDFGIPFMKQRLPRQGRVSSPFFTRLHIGEVDACSLSLTNCEPNFTFAHVARCFVSVCGSN